MRCSTHPALELTVYQRGTTDFPRGESEVVVRRVGRRVILEPVDEWPDQFLKSLGSLSAEIPRRTRVPITKLRDPFS